MRTRIQRIARRVEAGWWKIKDVDTGQIDWNQPDKATGLINAIPSSDDTDTLYNGDGPADVMGQAIKDIATLYREAWDRDPTIRELRAVANFVINGREFGGDYKACLIAASAEEDAQKVYEESLDKSYWKEVSDKFPESNSSQATEATQWVFEQMEQDFAREFEPEWWFLVGNVLKNKIHAGLT